MSGVIIACSIFFRAESYDLEALRSRWHRLVVARFPLAEHSGRLLLLGDHTHVVKDGGRMPGVVSLRESSETQSKPGYFRGQCWGAVGVLTNPLSACFCLPLSLQLHQGFQHLGQSIASFSLGERVVQMALDFACRQDRPALMVLDAFFSTGPVFRLAMSVWSIRLKQPYLQIITRAKKNYVAYLPPRSKPPGQRGRPRIYGDKVHLWEVFDHETTLFEAVEMTVYGKTEIVRLAAAELLWRPIGQPLQFVWAITSRGPIVLMSSDRTLPPAFILEAYCHRVRVEVLFDTLKNVIGAFRFHFWSKHLPRHSRKPVSNQRLKAPAPEHLEKVARCWLAMEMFVFCATVATGLLQGFALSYRQGIWKRQVLYLRTRSRELPSERTVRQVLAPIMARHLLQACPKSLFGKIRAAVNEDEDDEPAIR